MSELKSTLTRGDADCPNWPQLPVTAAAKTQTEGSPGKWNWQSSSKISQRWRSWRPPNETDHLCDFKETVSLLQQRSIGGLSILRCPLGPVTKEHSQLSCNFANVSVVAFSKLRTYNNNNSELLKVLLICAVHTYPADSVSLFHMSDWLTVCLPACLSLSHSFSKLDTVRGIIGCVFYLIVACREANTALEFSYKNYYFGKQTLSERQQREWGDLEYLLNNDSDNCQYSLFIYTQ